MKSLHGIGVLLVAIALAAPTGLAQTTTIDNPDDSTPTTLYFHIFDTFNKFVINTQPMDASYFEIGGNNFPSMSGTPVNDAYGGDFDFNSIYGYSTAGPVEYGFIENGRPRFHPERGIAATVDIDESVTPIVYLYLDIRDVFGTDLAPNYLEDFNVRVIMQEGDDPGVGADLDAGADIMQGHVVYDLADASFDAGEFFGPADPAQGSANDQFEGQTNPATGNAILTPDEDGIVELQVPMTILQDRIPKSEAFNIRIDWFQTHGGAFEEGQYAEPFFRFYADEDHLARMELAVTNPVYLSFIHPQVAANTLLIHAGANSPWGTYDLDIANTTIEITGPATPRDLRQVLSTNEHVHGLHDQDAQLTYLWDFRKENAPDGEYTIRMSVTNDAKNAVATGAAKFIIEGDTATGIDTEGEVVEGTGQEDVDTPSAGLLPVLGFIAAALVAARRRWGA